MLAAPAGLRAARGYLQGLLQDHGRRPRREPGRDQARLSPARAQISSGRQQGSERGREVQGSAGSVRGAEGSGEARRLRPARLELALRARNSVRRPTGAGTSSSPRRRSAARRGQAASAISSRRCSASAVRSAAASRGGGRAARGFAAAGEDHVAKIQIDLEDAFRGGSADDRAEGPAARRGRSRRP